MLVEHEASSENLTLLVTWERTERSFGPVKSSRGCERIKCGGSKDEDVKGCERMK